MPSLSPGCGGYASESAWSGSGGGVSQVFARPPFQKGCGVPTGTQRLVPDVALEADTSPGNYVAENGSWGIVGGTSDAPPQWAGPAPQPAPQSGGAPRQPRGPPFRPLRAAPPPPRPPRLERRHTT